MYSDDKEFQATQRYQHPNNSVKCDLCLRLFNDTGLVKRSEAKRDTIGGERW